VQLIIVTGNKKMDDPEKVSDQNISSFEGPVCPIPLTHRDNIVLGHGSGGKMTQDLIKKIFRVNFENPILAAGNDFARINISDQGNFELAVSTDCHIVSPLFYPGGDIGRLSVCGTVNDISMSGGIPLYITAGFIIEEGFAVEKLEKIAQSMQEAAVEAGVQIVAGDTKVAEKGKADGLFIITSGVALVPKQRKIGGQMAQPGDSVLISGAIGDHGMAVLQARGDLGFDIDIESDQAPLNHMIQDLLEVVPNVHVLRDPTRGGLATTLNEIAMQSSVNITIEEDLIPVKRSVRSACELLGFDPFYVANEGKVIVILPEKDEKKALVVLQKNRYGKSACKIGSVAQTPAGRVLLKTRIGTHRILDVLAGEMLPRIC
jgi:hydrogenase expression/formation protein HypE